VLQRLVCDTNTHYTAAVFSIPRFSESIRDTFVSFASPSPSKRRNARLLIAFGSVRVAHAHDSFGSYVHARQRHLSASRRFRFFTYACTSVPVQPSFKPVMDNSKLLECQLLEYSNPAGQSIGKKKVHSKYEF
jgi:hypothetical protein